VQGPAPEGTGDEAIQPTYFGRNVMIGWAVTFFVIALIAAVLGFSGIAGTAVNIAWALAVIGIILAIVFAVMGRRPPI
jgi:uncharacterized membrane protein YtjA (UPF0391 family)